MNEAPQEALWGLSGILGAIAARVVDGGRRARPTVSTLDFSIDDLGPQFDGYTFVVLADLHHAPTRKVQWLREVVDLANAAAPDVIALLGDYATSFRRTPSMSRVWYRTALSAMASVCEGLRARDGVVAVLGNHDYYADAEYVQGWLRGIGADVLVNQARLIRRGDSLLRIAGMDDVNVGELDARAGCGVGVEVPTVVLTHHPDGILHLAPDLRVDVVLAGHTHGGQVVIPGIGAPLTMSRVCGRRTASGWVPNDRAALYVSRGVGAQLPLPIRLNCPAEILVFRLRAGRQHPL